MSPPGAIATQPAWTIERILKTTHDYFAGKGLDSPRLDAELLLAQVLGVNRVYLYTHFDRPLSDAERDAYRALVKRRAAFEPVAYILGEREFYGRVFRVQRDVLVPRPETEHLIDEVLAWVKARGLASPRIVDVGAGSGAIVVTLALELPQAEVHAVDLSAAALQVARENASRLGAQATFHEGDLLAPVAGAAAFDLVVSNPPYIGTSERDQVQRDVLDHEPHLALFAGDDGLDVIRRLVVDAASVVRAGGLLAFELGDTQKEAVRALLERGPWTNIRFAADLAGHARVALAERAE